VADHPVLIGDTAVLGFLVFRSAKTPACKRYTPVAELPHRIQKLVCGDGQIAFDRIDRVILRRVVGEHNVSVLRPHPGDFIRSMAPDQYQSGDIFENVRVLISVASI
jgi:hypothetical protein